MEKDYILLFDELGEPYIAHAWLRKGRTPKYKQKVENFYGPGKHLYLYTDRDVARYRRYGSPKSYNQNLKYKQTLSGRIKDKLGVDELITRNESRSARDIAKSSLNKHASGENVLKSERANKEANQAQTEYDNTLLGRLENNKNARQTKLSEIRASKSDEIEPPKETILKEKVLTEDKEVEKVLTEDKEVEKVLTEDKEVKDREVEKKEEEKTTATKGSSASGSSKSSGTSASTANQNAAQTNSNIIGRVRTATMSEYNKDDPDFSEENRAKAEEIEGTEFKVFKNKDGQWVVLADDRKWVLPEGIDATSSRIKLSLQSVVQKINTAKKSDSNAYSERSEWAKEITAAINEAIRKLVADSSIKTT